MKLNGKVDFINVDLRIFVTPQNKEGVKRALEVLALYDAIGSYTKKRYYKTNRGIGLIPKNIVKGWIEMGTIAKIAPNRREGQRMIGAFSGKMEDFKLYLKSGRNLNISREDLLKFLDSMEEIAVMAYKHETSLSNIKEQFEILRESVISYSGYSIA